MSFLSKVKSVLSSPSIVEKAADAAMKGIDATWYTDEEKSTNLLKILALTKGASPARRSIAMIVMVLWSITGINILILLNIAACIDDPTTINLAIDRLTEFSIDYVAKPTGLVLAFYFLKNILPSKG